MGMGPEGRLVNGEDSDTAPVVALTKKGGGQPAGRLVTQEEEEMVGRVLVLHSMEGRVAGLAAAVGRELDGQN